MGLFDFEGVSPGVPGRTGPTLGARGSISRRVSISQLVGATFRREDEEEDADGLPPLPSPDGGGGGGGFTLSFAQTAAGARLAASLARETERVSGREALKLQATLQSLAMDLLPPGDVETAMRQVRRGELVKSKLAFQAVLENLSDASQNEERRADLALQEENEGRVLRQARSRITIDMMGRDLGLAVLFALGGK